MGALRKKSFERLNVIKPQQILLLSIYSLSGAWWQFQKLTCLGTDRLPAIKTFWPRLYRWTVPKQQQKVGGVELSKYRRERRSYKIGDEQSDTWSYSDVSLVVLPTFCYLVYKLFSFQFFQQFIRDIHCNCILSQPLISSLTAMFWPNLLSLFRAFLIYGALSTILT